VFKDCLIDYKDYSGQANINVLKFQKSSVRVEDCTIYCPDSDYKVDGIDADYDVGEIGQPGFQDYTLPPVASRVTGKI